MKTVSSLILVAVINLFVWVPCSSAGGPLDVDCNVLETTIVQVDAILESNNVDCANAGDLISISFQDPAFFNNLSNLIAAASGSTIFFTSPEEMLATIAKCQLMKHLIDECLD